VVRISNASPLILPLGCLIKGLALTTRHAVANMEHHLQEAALGYWTSVRDLKKLSQIALLACHTKLETAIWKRLEFRNQVLLC